ncbi:hypothetical protein THRCLA_02851 [Thraustotheca clavata]|uniref:Uncharacterized protein n=1 Tax=Thraustotheca clavata TaxID=74557 RepID=A0A1W0A436_9STRA|nr:hypothetical protein THRCLA_02851 [Thraustotheca clavata]
MGNQISGESLLKAAKQGNIEYVKFLLKNKVDPDHNYGKSLCIAAQNGHEKIVSLLISHGANVNIKRTSLEAADWKGQTEVVLLLISHGANVNQLDTVNNI